MTRRGRGERGSATVLAMSMLAVLLLVAAALGVVAALFRAHRIAASAADLSALAAAAALGRGQDPCTTAGRIAADNGGRLVECRPVATDVWVTVAVAGPDWLAPRVDLTARSRAGPDR